MRIIESKTTLAEMYGFDESELFERSDAFGETYYTFIDIHIHVMIGSETMKTLINKLSTLGKIESMSYDNNSYFEIGFTLNEWGNNYNRYIKDEFLGRVEKTISSILTKLDINKYSILLHRSTISTDETVDSKEIDIGFPEEYYC